MILYASGGSPVSDGRIIPYSSPSSSDFFAGVSEELHHFWHVEEPEVNQPVQQAQGMTPEAAQNQGQHPLGAPEAKTGASSSLSVSRVEGWLYPEEGVSSTARNLDPGGQPQALAPAEDPRNQLKREIITRMKAFYPNDPWNPDNPLIQGEALFPGGKGKRNIRPMTVEELQHILAQLDQKGKKAYWAKELHRRIDTWTWAKPS